MPTKVLQTEFKAKDGGLINMMSQAGASADQLKKKLLELEQAGKKNGEEGGGGAGVIKELRNGLGAKSELGQLGKALKGGGAVLGLSLIGSELAKVTQQAKELTTQYKNGQITLGGMVEEAAKGVPVFGAFWQAGRNIRDVLASFDGLANSGFGKLIGLNDLAYAQQINKELAVTKAVDDYIASTLDKQKSLLKDIANEHTKVAQEAGKVGKQGDELKAYEQKVAQANRLTEIEKKRSEAIAESDKKRNEAMAKVREDKDMSPAMAYKAEQQIQQAANKDKLQINNGFNSEIRDANNLAYLENMQLEKEHAEKIDDFKRDAAKEITDHQKEAYADRLKELGDNLGAELVMIEKNAADKKEAILKALKEQLKGASQADQELYNQTAGNQIAAIDDEARQQAATARKVQQETAVKTLQDAQLAVLRQQADSGDDYAALELKRLETAKANNDEQKKLLDLLKQQLTPAERAAALAELAAMRTADHAGVLKQLQDQQESVLQAQANSATTEKDKKEADKQLELMKLKKAYNEQALKTAAILNNPNATQADKASAIANLKAYESTLGAQYDKDLKKEVSPLKKTSEAQERGLLITGVAAAARAKADPAERAAKSSEEAAKLQAQANQAFNQWVAYQKAQDAKAPKVVFGVSDN